MGVKMGYFSIWHWIIVIVVAFIFFGKRDRITGFFTDLAKGLKAFKKGIAEEDSSCEKSKKSNDIDKK